MVVQLGEPGGMDEKCNWALDFQLPVAVVPWMGLMSGFLFGPT